MVEAKGEPSQEYLALYQKLCDFFDGKGERHFPQMGLETLFLQLSPASIRQQLKKEHDIEIEGDFIYVKHELHGDLGEHDTALSFELAFLLNGDMCYQFGAKSGFFTHYPKNFIYLVASNPAMEVVRKLLMKHTNEALDKFSQVSAESSAPQEDSEA